MARCRTLVRQRHRLQPARRVRPQWNRDEPVLPLVDTAIGVKVVRGFAREFNLEAHHVIGERAPGAHAKNVGRVHLRASKVVLA
jgi:hypothetical protein